MTLVGIEAAIADQQRRLCSGDIHSKEDVDRVRSEVEAEMRSLLARKSALLRNARRRDARRRDGK